MSVQVVVHPATPAHAQVAAPVVHSSKSAAEKKMKMVISQLCYEHNIYQFKTRNNKMSFKSKIVLTDTSDAVSIHHVASIAAASK